MKRDWFKSAAIVAALFAGGAAHAENPIVPGWYADPEIRVFDGQYWIYPTYSETSGTPAWSE